MNVQTKAKLAILTDTVIANKELGMDRLHQAKKEANNNFADEKKFVFVIDSLIDVFGGLKDTHSSQDLESAVHTLEQNESTDVRVAGRILRWTARNRGVILP